MSAKNNYVPVSRAELKLAAAAAEFRFSFRGKTVLDVGSSTGGFTEFALSRGARKVIAIEKGSRQMRAPLRFDPRVELREKTDFLEVKNLADSVDVMVADVSFISLRSILVHAARNFQITDFLVMLKPQFEAKKTQLNRGVVKNSAMRRQIIRDFERWLAGQRFFVVKKRDNKLAGRKGNKERFYWLRNC